MITVSHICRITAEQICMVTNTNLDLAHVLDRVPGVKVREDGGLGSGTSINLNGFTGKHVKLFIDGVPMDGASSSFSVRCQTKVHNLSSN